MWYGYFKVIEIYVMILIISSNNYFSTANIIYIMKLFEKINSWCFDEPG